MRFSYEQITTVENTIASNKEKLNAAFKLLRKNNLIARQNFGCCGSCGSYEIATKMEELLDQGKAVNGYVFFNRQGAEALRGDGYRPADGTLYLSYADGSTNKYPNNTPLSGLEVGRMLAVALTEVGLVFEWDGDADHCVIVKMAEKQVEKVLVEADSETWGE